MSYTDLRFEQNNCVIDYMFISFIDVDKSQLSEGQILQGYFSCNGKKFNYTEIEKGVLLNGIRFNDIVSFINYLSSIKDSLYDFIFLPLVENIITAPRTDIYYMKPRAIDIAFKKLFKITKVSRKEYTKQFNWSLNSSSKRLFMHKLYEICDIFIVVDDCLFPWVDFINEYKFANLIAPHGVFRTNSAYYRFDVLDETAFKAALAKSKFLNN